eukprot:1156861-Pelagomonas_calceolata.AAC.4
MTASTKHAIQFSNPSNGEGETQAWKGGQQPTRSASVWSLLHGLSYCRNERLLDQGIRVPENISQAVPDYSFPYGTGSSARYQSRPDITFVRSAHFLLAILAKEKKSMRRPKAAFIKGRSPNWKARGLTRRHSKPILDTDSLGESQKQI